MCLFQLDCFAIFAHYQDNFLEIQFQSLGGAMYVFFGWKFDQLLTGQNWFVKDIFSIRWIRWTYRIDCKIFGLFLSEEDAISCPVKLNDSRWGTLAVWDAHSTQNRTFPNGWGGDGVDREDLNLSSLNHTFLSLLRWTHTCVHHSNLLWFSGYSWARRLTSALGCRHRRRKLGPRRAWSALWWRFFQLSVKLNSTLKMSSLY